MSKKGQNDRGVYRAIYVNLWDDPDFQSLDPDARLVLLNLRTGPLSNMPCLYRFYYEAIERQTGLTRKRIDRAFNTLSHTPTDTPWISIKDGLVWVKNGLRYDPNIYLNNPQHIKALQNIVNGLPKSKIVIDFCTYYGIDIPFHIPHNIPPAIPPPIHPEKEKEEEKEPEEEPEKERRATVSVTPTEIFDLWNVTVKYLTKVVSLSESRTDKIRTRIKEHPDLDFWQIVFLKADEVLIPASKTHPKEWKPDFDWIMENDTNVLKVMEDKYPKREGNTLKSDPAKVKCEWCGEVYRVKDNHQCKEK